MLSELDPVKGLKVIEALLFFLHKRGILVWLSGTGGVDKRC